ncbi:porin family protein [Mangrovibacterium diazotrophicum]|uniref:Outer membrane protein with beta-barrel domain n=1 Tax=Mangrovibacterium diazotrophicum TaxID=1261403 RepID=A0A419WAU4_9BACT|nr:porin family protein [Mangrovibacterium diazotrophicum]RKD92536.1 outer membrane protein with beta-barrel domain [Mangrovibacterium diazotrophicum]
MKRTTIILTLLLACLGLNAQVYIKTIQLPDQPNMPKLGLVGGFQLSNFHSTEIGEPNVQGGFHFGLTYNLPISERISFEPQLIYSKKGGQIDYAQVAYFYYYTGTLRYRLHYLETPILFNIHANKRLDFVIGGYTSYLADATFSLTTPVGYGYGELNYDDFEKFDFGMVGGIAFNFPFSKMTLKYSHGLQEVANANSAYLFLEGAQNQVFSVSFTRYFR